MCVVPVIMIHGLATHLLRFNMKKKPCNCKLCHYNKILSKYIPKTEKKFWKIYKEIDIALFDASVDASILNGSWPSAVEQLEKALLLAKNKKLLNSDK